MSGLTVTCLSFWVDGTSSRYFFRLNRSIKEICLSFWKSSLNPFLTSPTNRYPPGYRKRMWRSIRSILPIATKFRQWLDIIISQLNAKFRLDTVYHRVARRIWISSFCEAVMAHRRRANYYSSEESTMLFFWEKTTTVVPVKARKMNWNVICKFLVKNRGKRPINCDPKLSLSCVTRASTCSIFFPWAFKFRLDSLVASVIPVISMK